jgi:hypothetical protein
MRRYWNYLGIVLGVALAGAAQSEEVDSPSMFEDSLVRAEEPIRLVSCESEVTGSPLRCAPVRRSACSLTAEMPLLSVYANHGSGAGGNNWFNDFDTSPALRLAAAYQSSGILGVRGRFFTYDTSGNAAPNDRFDVRLYDLEATTGLNVGGWNILGFGGVRWGSINFSRQNTGLVQDFDGFGMTCGADVRRNVGHGFALVGGFRQSFLYGDSNSNFGGPPLSNGVVPITEFRLGTDYTTTLRGGSKLIAGVGFEHQQYSSLSVRNAMIDPEDVDVALAGPVFSLTWLR